MHEFELGIWKAVFIHLLRILDCEAESLKHKLDTRYAYLDLQVAVILIIFRFREIPPFGRDGVRKTRSNRSVSKKMTAHDYEATLQCAIPVFDHLLPEPHNVHALKLLFDLAHWHALAKLCMHADTTLELLTPLLATTSENSRTRRVPCFSLSP